MKTSLTIVALFLLTTGFGQPAQEVDPTRIKPWFPKLTCEYQAVYHFGDSERESKLILICGIDQWYGQLVSGRWSSDGKAWINHYENLTNLKIEAHAFYSDKTNGEFIFYDGANERIKGLKVHQSWNGDDGPEIGYKSYPIQDYYPGKFTQASFRLLSREELVKMPKSALKIMRNEIYARYGYKFSAGGEMDTYFKKQDWYSGQHDDVDKFLTDLEKKNRELIQQIESKK